MLSQTVQAPIEARCPHCGGFIDSRAVSRYCTNCRGLLRYSIPDSPVGDLWLLRPGEMVVGGDENDPSRQHLYVVQPGTLHCNEAALTTIYSAQPENLQRFHQDFSESPEVQKVIIKEFIDDPRQGAVSPSEYREWIETLLMIRHPNILRTYEERTFGPRHLLFQKYVEGRTLSEWFFGGVRERGVSERVEHLHVKEGLLWHIAAQLADALCYLHHALNPPLIHHDLTPYNVLMGSDGHCTIIDLGRPGRRMRSPHYAPIELYGQVPGLEPNHRTDQYLLGTLLFSIACGVPASAVIRAVSDEPIIIEAPSRWEYEHGRMELGVRQLPLRRFRPDLSEGFCQWIERLMAVHPNERFPSDEAMLQALHALKQPAKSRTQEPTKRGNWIVRGFIGLLRLLGFALWRLGKGILKRILPLSLIGLLFVPAMRESLYNSVLAGVGDTLLRVGATQAAMDCFNQLPEEDAAKHYHRARALLAREQTEEAFQALRLAKSLRSDWQPVRQALMAVLTQLIEGWTRTANRLVQQGDLPNATRYYEKIVHFAPYQASAWRQLAILAERQGNRGKAITYWKRYTALQPQAVDAHVALARLYADRGYVTRAYWQILRAYQLSQSSAPLKPASARLLNDVRRRVANLCTQQALAASRWSNPQQRLNAQLLWLKRAVELNPQSPSLRYQYGVILAKAGRYSSALEQFKRCHTLQPNYPNLTQQLAACYKKMGTTPSDG